MEIGICENIMSKEKEMCRCKNVANYRKRNNGVKKVVDIISGINEAHKMGMFAGKCGKREKCLV